MRMMKRVCILSALCALPLMSACAPESPDSDAPLPAPAPTPTPAADRGDFVADIGAGPVHQKLETTTSFEEPDPQLSRVLEQKRSFLTVAAPGPRPRTEMETTLERAAAAPPDAPFSLVIALAEPEFELGRLRGVQGNAREAIVAERRLQLAPSQDALTARLTALGAAHVERFWLTNDVAVTVPAGEVARIATWPEVVGIARGREAVQEMASYSGLEMRNGMKLTAIHADGTKGNNGGRAGAAIRIGIVDAGPLVANHVGFQAGGSSRVIKNYDCTSGTCVNGAAAGTTTNHGNNVATIAVGSIDAGQDPAITSTTERARRSGAAPSANLFYYDITGTGTDGIKRGIDKAVADGVDIVNYSGAAGGLECNTTADPSLINEAIKAATDAGTLVVVAAGNHDPVKDTCISYPALRSEAVAVGALDTSSTGVAYDSTPMATYSNTGLVPVRTFTGSSSTMVGVAIAAPGQLTLLDYFGSASYNGGAFAGTSIAAPTVTGAAGLLRQGYNAVGFAGNDARVLLSALLLQGDGWDDENGVVRTSRGSRTSGFGRVHLHTPSSSNLVAPWGWGWHSKVLAHHETWVIPIGGGALTGVQQWKGSVVWTETDLTNVADIDVSVFDKGTDCNATPVLVASQTDFDLRNRIQLRGAAVTGRCLEMRIFGFNVPAGGRTVFTSDYFHAGTPD